MQSIKAARTKLTLNYTAKGWSNILRVIDWLQGWVKAGYGWCATHFADRYRRADNACGSNLVVIDIDGDTTLDAFWATDLQLSNGVLLPIHLLVTQSSEHRFRALFPLEIELESTAQHRGAYWLIVNRLLADLGFDRA